MWSRLWLNDLFHFTFDHENLIEHVSQKRVSHELYVKFVTEWVGYAWEWQTREFLRIFLEKTWHEPVFQDKLLEIIKWKSESDEVKLLV